MEYKCWKVTVRSLYSFEVEHICYISVVRDSYRHICTHVLLIRFDRRDSSHFYIPMLSTLFPHFSQRQWYIDCMVSLSRVHFRLLATYHTPFRTNFIQSTRKHVIDFILEPDTTHT